MILLAIDTAASLCAACVHDAAAARELGRSVRDIGKGHAEALMDVVAEAMAQAHVGYADLGAIAVSVGPGSFTGVRVGVSAARGLALALKVPALGVTTLEALAAEAREKYGARPVLAILNAKRDEFYAASYSADGSEMTAPAVLHIGDAMALLGDHMVVAGTGAHALAAATGRSLAFGPLTATADIDAYAKCAANRPLTKSKPKPVYLRGPDARPQTGFALPRTVP